MIDSTRPVREIMSHPAVRVPAETTVAEVQLLLAERGFGGVPVVDSEDHPIGMVSKTDILWNAYETEPDSMDRPQHVLDVMQREPITVLETATIRQAAALMASARVHQLPVVDRAGKLVGIVSSLDMVAWLGSSGHVRPAASSARGTLADAKAALLP